MTNKHATRFSHPSFALWFIEDLAAGLSPTMAEYLGIDKGSTCAMTGSSSNSLTCSTTPPDTSIWKAPRDVEDLTLYAWLVAEWNGNDIYSDCRGNCSFSFLGRQTPVLKLTLNASFLELNGRRRFSDAAGGYMAVTAGDVLYLNYNTSGDVINGQGFDWSTVSTTNISLTLNGEELDVDLIVKEHPMGEASFFDVVLAVSISEAVRPCIGMKLILRIEPYGRGVIIGESAISVLPVITNISHTSGSMGGGLTVTITGSSMSAFGLGPLNVTVGGRPCDDPQTTNGSIVCVTTDEDPQGRENQGFGSVAVQVFGVQSACMVDNVFKTVARFNNTLNATQEHQLFAHVGCAFQFNSNASFTPRFTSVSPTNGHYPQTVTITGQGFAAAGNVVTMGYRDAEVLSENATTIVVTVPKHVGGTYQLAVHVPNKGLAVGTKKWFRFDSGVLSVSPKQGSRYAGQRITITGFGFAPAGESFQNDEDSKYAKLFGSWVNMGTANGTAPFDFDAQHATFDTIVAVTHMRYWRALDGDVSEDW